METYEKKYKDALGWMQSVYPTMTGADKEDAEHFFPELKESEDEKIRKELIQLIGCMHDADTRKKVWMTWLEKQKVLTAEEDLQGKEDVLWCIKQAKKHAKDENEMGTCWFAEKWLEKQKTVGEIVERCKNSWYNEGKIAGQFEGITDDEKYQQGWHDALEKQNSNIDNANKEYWRGYREGKQEILDKYAELEKQGQVKESSISQHENKTCKENSNSLTGKDEQKSADKVKPKFKVGDWVVFIGTESVYQVEKIENSEYTLRHILGGSLCLSFSNEELIREWTIQDARDGDVLAVDVIESHPSPFVAICKKQNGESFETYCFIGHDGKFYKGEIGHASEYVHPATKEQRDTLIQAMADAGYTFDFDKKELKTIIEEVNGEDYGIDGLWHAQRILERTLGSVEGYQSDDGILDHKAAITAVKKLYKQNPVEQKPANNIEPKFKVGDWITNGEYTWKVTDIKSLDYILQSQDGNIVDNTISYVDYNYFRLWSINDAKPGDVLVDIYNNIGIFQKCEGRYWQSYLYLGCNGELLGFSDGGYHKQTNTHPATKEQRDALEKAMADAGYISDSDKKEVKKIEQKSAWSEEDEMITLSIEQVINCASLLNIVPEKIDKIRSWLKSLKERFM